MQIYKSHKAKYRIVKKISGDNVQYHVQQNEGRRNFCKEMFGNVIVLMGIVYFAPFIIAFLLFPRLLWRDVIQWPTQEGAEKSIQDHIASDNKQFFRQRDRASAKKLKETIFI